MGQSVSDTGRPGQKWWKTGFATSLLLFLWLLLTIRARFNAVYSTCSVYSVILIFYFYWSCRSMIINVPAIGKINTAWFKKMDSFLYVYISWTIHGIWMTYITFVRRDPKVWNITPRALVFCTAVQQRQLRTKLAARQHKIFCVCEFIKTESATAVQRAFRLRFNIHPPTRKSICRWNNQFEQIGCLCKGKPVERAENLEYRNQLSGVCWGAVYSSIGAIFLNHSVY